LPLRVSLVVTHNKKMKCLLCTNDKEKIAKAHIFPIGFSNNIETKGRAETYSSSGERGRLLQKAIYDESIVCHDCEHDILEPLDDYAIKILRDKQGLFDQVSHPDAKDTKLLVFDNIDKTRLRRFFASVLWRISVSKQLELRSLSVGSFYEQKIRDDLYNGGVVDYVDVFVFFLTDPMHNAFFVPYRKKIKPIDTKRDSQSVNGWVLQFPNISITLSLDKRRHPNRVFFKLSPELTESNTELLISTSIHPENEAYKFMVVEAKNNKGMIEQIMDALKNSKKKSCITTPSTRWK
jgi:hypothetical protein